MVDHPARRGLARRILQSAKGRLAVLGRRVDFAGRGNRRQITNFIAVQVDVSAIKQAEEELRVSEQRFRSLVETSLPGISNRRNGKPLFVNRSFADIFGYDEPADIIQLGSLEPLRWEASDSAASDSQGATRSVAPVVRNASLTGMGAPSRMRIGHSMLS